MLRSFSVIVVTAAVWLAGAGPARADVDSQSTAALQKLFARSSVDPSMFAANFLSAIPVSDVQAFVTSYVTRIGAPATIAKDGYDYDLTSPKGSIKVGISFDQNGKITRLAFHDELSPENYAALQRMLSADTLQTDWFEPAYNHDVPTQKLVSLLADIHTRLGKFVRIDTTNGEYFAIYERGKTHAQVSADTDGRIDYFAISKT